MSPAELQTLLLAEPAAELALLDVRETRWFVQRHPNLARNAPFSGLELQIGALVPRRSTPVVLYDDYNAPDGVAQAAAALLARIGYTDVRTLDGGLQRWVTEGLPAIDGYGTLVKAFGDRVRLHYGTPSLPVEALRARQREGLPTTLVDARPRAEFEFLSLPGAHNHPGTELALRHFEPHDAGHVWAINCFSRTRGIIGATTLRLLGRAPDAVFVEDGVMAWGLQGAPTVQNAAPDDELPPESPQVLRRIADELIERFALPVADAEQLAHWRTDDTRTLYIFDVRPTADPALAGTAVQQVPGGQLLMHFENLVGTRGARIVLLDDPAHRLRAAVTSFWLTQLNQAEVHIHDGGAFLPEHAGLYLARRRGRGPRGARRAPALAGFGGGVHLAPGRNAGLEGFRAAADHRFRAGPAPDPVRRRLGLGDAGVRPAPRRSLGRLPGVGARAGRAGAARPVGALSLLPSSSRFLASRCRRRVGQLDLDVEHFEVVLGFQVDLDVVRVDRHVFGNHRHQLALEFGQIVGALFAAEAGALVREDDLQAFFCDACSLLLLAKQEREKRHAYLPPKIRLKKPGFSASTKRIGLSSPRKRATTSL
jgi:rhodanese-related sulfurtransferase